MYTGACARFCILVQFIIMSLGLCGADHRVHREHRQRHVRIEGEVLASSLATLSASRVAQSIADLAKEGLPWGSIQQRSGIMSMPIEAVAKVVDAYRHRYAWKYGVVKSKICFGCNFGDYAVVCLSPDGRTLVAEIIYYEGARRYSYRHVIDTRSRSTLRSDETLDAESWNESRISPDGRYLVVAKAYAIFSVDLINGTRKCLAENLPAQDCRVFTFLLPDNNHAVAAYHNGIVTTWRIEDSKKIFTIDYSHDVPADALAVGSCDDGSIILSCINHASDSFLIDPSHHSISVLPPCTNDPQEFCTMATLSAGTQTVMSVDIFTKTVCIRDVTQPPTRHMKINFNRSSLFPFAAGPYIFASAADRPMSVLVSPVTGIILRKLRTDHGDGCHIYKLCIADSGHCVAMAMLGGPTYLWRDTLLEGMIDYLESRSSHNVHNVTS